MSSGGGGTNTTTTQSGPPQQVLDNYQGVFNQAKQVAGQPQQQYSGPVVAGFSPMQQTGFDNLNTAVNAGSPFTNAASNYYATGADQGSKYLTNAGTMLDPSHFGGTISQYQSPYTQSVVDATQAQFNNQNQIAQNQLGGSAAQAGAFGGDRQAVAQAVLAGQQQASQAPVIAGLYNTGFQNATNAAQSAAWLNNAAGTGLANINYGAGAGMGGLGAQAFSQGITGANAQLTAGAQQQAQAQQELNVPYQAFLAAQGYPFQVTNFLEGMATGTGSLSGTMGSTTSPGPSPVSQVAGLGVAGLGAATQAGAFSPGGVFNSGAGTAAAAQAAAAAGSSGIGTLADGAGGLLVARGGRIGGFASGGDTSVNGMPVPDMSVTDIPADAGVGGSAGFMGPGGSMLGTSGTLMKPTGTTSTTTGGGGGDSTFGSIIKGIGELAAAYWGGPVGAAAGTAFNSQVHFNRGGGIEDFAKHRRIAGMGRMMVGPHHFDTGGGVTPGLSASFSGNPMAITAEQSYSGLPDEQLREMAQRLPPSTPQGMMVQRALRARMMNPGNNPGQAMVGGQAGGMTGPPPGASGTPMTGGMQPVQPGGYADGGEPEEDDDALPELVIPHVGPDVPFGGASSRPRQVVSEPAAGMARGTVPMNGGTGYTPPPAEYVPLILAAAERHHVDPKRLSWLMSTESHWNPHARNPQSGAEGLGQFMPATAREVGIDPMVAEQAIDGSAAYLRKKLDQSGGDYERAFERYGTFSTWQGRGADDAVRARYRRFMGDGAARGGQIGGFAPGGDVGGDPSTAVLGYDADYRTRSPYDPSGLTNDPDQIPSLGPPTFSDSVIDPSGLTIPGTRVPRVPRTFTSHAPEPSGSQASSGADQTTAVTSAEPGMGPMKARDFSGDEAYKPSIGEALMAAGFGMMAGTSPHALTNIGAGGLAGVRNYQQQRQLSINDQARRDAAETNRVWRLNQAINNERRTDAYGNLVGARGNLIDQQAVLTAGKAAALPQQTENATTRANAYAGGVDSANNLRSARADKLAWDQSHGDATLAEKAQHDADLVTKYGLDRDQRGQIAGDRNTTASRAIDARTETAAAREARFTQKMQNDEGWRNRQEQMRQSGIDSAAQNAIFGSAIRGANGSVPMFNRLVDAALAKGALRTPMRPTPPAAASVAPAGAPPKIIRYGLDGEPIP